MASAVTAFDPSTAQPIGGGGGFDPSSAQPSSARGIGSPSPRAQAMSETMFGTGVGQHQAFTGQQDIEKSMRAAGKTDAEIQADPTWQSSARDVNRSVSASGTNMALGAVGGEAAGPVLGAALSKAGPVISRIVPGATSRAELGIKALGPSLDKDKIGQNVLSSLRPDYDALHAYRAKQLKTVADEMEEGPEKTAAFRKIYQHPRFDELRKFEDSPLGQKAVATTTKYSSVPKINPKAFLKQAFNSPQDVRDLKGLYNGDQAAVEGVAKQYVASDLKSVMENAKTASSTEANPFKSEAGSVATALQKWRLKNQDWLKEVPETKKTVDTFVDNMTDLAKTQKHFKYAVSAGATLGLIEGGEHPFSWISRLFGGVE